MQPTLSLRLYGLDLLGPRQHREQRLRLGDLRHFRRRGKPSSAGARTACASTGRPVDW